MNTVTAPSPEILHLLSALSCVHAEDNYTRWRNIAASIASTHDNAEGLALFLAWAAGSPTFDLQENTEVWASVRTLRQFSLGTLFYHAKAGGFDYKDPVEPPEALVQRYHSFLAQDTAGDYGAFLQQSDEKEATRIQRSLARRDAAALWQPSSRPLTDNAYLRRKFATQLDTTLRTLTALECEYALQGLMNDSQGRLRATLVDIDDNVVCYQECRGSAGRSDHEELYGSSGGTDKLFHGLSSGGMTVLGGRLADLERDRSTLYVVEGIATGLTCFLALRQPVVIAYNVGNIPKVVNAIRDRYPFIRLVGVADNDAKPVNWNSDTEEKDDRPHEDGLDYSFLECSLLQTAEDLTQSNVGLDVYRAFDFTVYMPEFTDYMDDSGRFLANMPHPSDINDLMALGGLGAVRQLFAAPPCRGTLIKQFTVNQRYIESDERPLTLPEHALVLSSPMNTGKTTSFSNLIQKHRAWCKQRSIECRVLVIAPGQNLCRMLAQDLQLDCYLDYKDIESQAKDLADSYAQDSGGDISNMMAQAFQHVDRQLLGKVSAQRLHLSNQLVITPNSLHKLALQRYSLVLIDEAEALLMDISQGEFFKGKSARVLHQMSDLIQHAEHAVVADAFGSLITYTFMHHTGVPVEWVNNTYPVRAGSTLFLSTEHGTVFVEWLALEAAKAAVEGRGEPVVIACFSKRLIKQVFVPQLPKDSYHIVTASDTQDIEKITQNRTDINKKRVIFYTSSLSHGYNIPDHHFKTAYGIFSDQMSTAMDCLQMMSRLRDISTFIIGLNARQVTRVTSPQKIRERYLKSCQTTGRGFGIYTRITPLTDHLTLDMMVATQTLRASHQQDLDGALARVAGMLGMAVRTAYPDTEEVEQLTLYRKDRRELRQQQSDDLMDELDGLPVLTAKDYRKPFPGVAERTREEDLILMKSKMFHELNVRDERWMNALVVQHVLGDLMSPLLFCCHLLMSNTLLKQIDQEEHGHRENNRLRHRYERMNAYRLLLGTIGVGSGLKCDGSIRWAQQEVSSELFYQQAKKILEKAWVYKLTDTEKGAFTGSTNVNVINNMVKKLASKSILKSETEVWEDRFQQKEYDGLEKSTGFADKKITYYSVNTKTLDEQRIFAVNYIHYHYGRDALRVRNLKKTVAVKYERIATVKFYRGTTTEKATAPRKTGTPSVGINIDLVESDDPFD